MNPVPCRNCGYNFMRTTEEIRKDFRHCHNCKKKEDKPMGEVQILVKCPQKIHAEIEEICINKGIDFSEYFISMHKENYCVVSQSSIEAVYPGRLENSDKPSSSFADNLVCDKEITSSNEAVQVKRKKK
jgi:hypothetical protein